MVGVVIYRSLVVIPLLKNDLLKTQAALIASASGAGIQVILIMLSAQVSKNGKDLAPNQSQHANHHRGNK